MLKPMLLSPAVLLLAFLPASFGQKPSKKPSHSRTRTCNHRGLKPARAGTKQMYKFDCSMCHGENGNGKTDLATSMKLTLDDWTNPAALANKTDRAALQHHPQGQGPTCPQRAPIAPRMTRSATW